MSERDNMKTTAKRIFVGAAKLCSLAIPYKLFMVGKRFYRMVIWQSAARRFAKVGEGCYMEWPFLLNGPENIVLGDNFSALSCLRIETFNEYHGQSFTPQLVIGNNVSFNNDCHIGCIDRVEIGNNVLGASRIYISDHYHGNLSADDLAAVPNRRPLSSKGPVIIKDNVWIGEGVAILPNVTIGENAIIGANSVVNRDVPANAIVAGVPARVIRYLQG
jgi:acetyltransferase-like isoleucine patch superfamily enzyme